VKLIMSQATLRTRPEKHQSTTKPASTWEELAALQGGFFCSTTT
jgi:hypothetical protein